MTFDVEAVLVRELHQVADGVEVPALAPLPREPHRRPLWQPLLAVAVVVLIVAGALAAVVALSGGDDEIQPAPSPSPTVATDDATDDPGEPEALSTEPPTVPYVVAGRLYVGGQQVPGTDWAFVEGTDTGWVAARFDSGEYTYWWGFDAEPQRIEASLPNGPAVSPGGGYWAGILDEGPDGSLTGGDTESGGEGFGGWPIELSDGNAPTSIAAVTDDGLVITGNGAGILWRPLVDGGTVDLADSAPGQVVIGNTAAGVLVGEGDPGEVDGTRGDVYLADISEDGEITPAQQVPNHDELAASADWLAWIEPGTLGGEVPGFGELQVQRLDGSDRGTLAPPDGRLFVVGNWAWEDDEHVVAAVVDNAGAERMVRCSPATQECVLLDTP